MAGIGSHHGPVAGTETWLTPPNIVTALGPFDLDPCAAPEPRPWPTAREHITLPTDGLALPWGQKNRVWCNPPYTNVEVRKWLARMVEHNHGTALIFARTETENFFEFVWQGATAVLFLRSPRLHFHYPDGRRADNNCGAPSVLVAYGDYDAERLRACELVGHYERLREPAGVFA